MDESMKEFVAFSRKLLRSLKEIKKYLDANEIELVKEKLDELIDDTQRDIES